MSYVFVIELHTVDIYVFVARPKRNPFKAILPKWSSPGVGLECRNDPCLRYRLILGLEMSLLRPVTMLK